MEQKLERKLEQQQTVTRLALCAGLAAALYAVAGKLKALESYQPWLEEHKIQAIALAAAALFALSLAVVPLPEAGAPEEPAGAPGPWDGYEPAEGPQ